jgi:hypothetical protein
VLLGGYQKQEQTPQRLPGLFFEFGTMVLKPKEAISDITNGEKLKGPSL